MKKQIREKLQDRYTLEVINKAIAKAERWMRAAYGEVDWQGYGDEIGDPVEGVETYCKETMANPDGRRTFNRGR